MPKIFSEQEREIIRTKLLHAGIEELENKSYRNIAVDSLAAKVGIAKGTFYHFFPSKEAYFYAVMQFVKEKNRNELKELLYGGKVQKEEIVACLYHRYTKIKTVYDYFSPEEMKIIVRKLPNGDEAADSVEFAEWICGALSVPEKAKKAKVIVNMCNIMAMAASNRDMLEPCAYEETVLLFCNTIADYIFQKEGAQPQ